MEFWKLNKENVPERIEGGVEVLRDHLLWKRVEETWVGPWRVSTVFLGMDLNPLGGEILLFETMVFYGGDGWELYCARYPSWEKAVEGHWAAVTWVKEELGWKERVKCWWRGKRWRFGGYWISLRKAVGKRLGFGGSSSTQ